MLSKAFVFSFNRGAYLRNCVESLLSNLPDAEVVVIDDGSDDPETIDVLASLRAPVSVHTSPGSREKRLGGLYNNMQSAWEMVGREEFFLFVQDDTQMVRKLTEDDFDYIRRYFQRKPEAAFLNPMFLRGHRSRGIDRALYLDPEFPAYYYDFSERLKDRSVAMYYTDVFIGRTQTLRAARWSFVNEDESANALRARQLFPKLGLMAHPFQMNLPLVPIYRGQRKTLTVALAERILGTKLRSYVDLEGERLEALIRRDLEVFPYAETFLTCHGRQPARPFRYNIPNAITVLRPFHKLELLVDRLRTGKR